MPNTVRYHSYMYNRTSRPHVASIHSHVVAMCTNCWRMTHVDIQAVDGQMGGSIDPGVDWEQRGSCSDKNLPPVVQTQR